MMHNNKFCAFKRVPISLSSAGGGGCDKVAECYID